MGSKSRRHGEVLRAAGQMAAAVPFAFVVAAVAATVLMHCVDPVHYGLWTGTGVFFFGSIDDSTQAQQVPGSTFYLYAFLFVVIGSMACREFAGFALAAWRKER